MHKIIRDLQKPFKHYPFSSIKNNLEKIKNNAHQTIKDLYEDLAKYESQLDYAGSLKYAKYLEDLTKMVKKVNKRNLAESSMAEDTQI